MPDVPNWLAGTMTVAFLVGCGIFLYPWLLKRRLGAAVVAAMTAVLALLYFYFDRGSGNAAASAAFALLWALAPLAAGVVVYRLQRR
jgi:Ca2+/Na+ antiporter